MSRIRTGDVRVEGLAQLNRGLRALGGRELQNELKDAGKESAEIVAAAGRANAYAQGSSLAKMAPSITAKGYTTGAAVSFGGARYPFAGGAEFGSIRYKQFKPWRGNGPGAGYAVYQSVRDHVDEVRDTYEDALFDLAERHGLR